MREEEVYQHLWAEHLAATDTWRVVGYVDRFLLVWAEDLATEGEAKAWIAGFFEGMEVDRP
jgi:hypothetical protein